MYSSTERTKHKIASELLKKILPVDDPFYGIQQPDETHNRNYKTVLDRTDIHLHYVFIPHNGASSKDGTNRIVAFFPIIDKEEYKKHEGVYDANESIPMMVIHRTIFTEKFHQYARLNIQQSLSEIHYYDFNRQWPIELKDYIASDNNTEIDKNEKVTFTKNLHLNKIRQCHKNE